MSPSSILEKPSDMTPEQIMNPQVLCLLLIFYSLVDQAYLSLLTNVSFYYYGNFSFVSLNTTFSTGLFLHL